nr:hypothetical protein [Candidatus Saccharibacteria bacterium]
MKRRFFCRILLVAVAVFGLLALSGILLAQGRSEEAFERVKAVQERHTDHLMAIKDVEGTAIGLDENDELVVKVFTARPGVRGIPKELDGVLVCPVVTGKIYALKPPSFAGQDKKNLPPAAPTGLTAKAVSDTAIDLAWNKNNEDNLSRYNVYRSTT